MLPMVRELEFRGEESPARRKRHIMVAMTALQFQGPRYVTQG